MDELIEELREVNQAVPIPLELPEEDDLVEVQEALFISLNEDFQEFMLTVSDVVYGTLEPVTASDPTSHTYLPEVAAIAWDAGLPRDLGWMSDAFLEHIRFAIDHAVDRLKPEAVIIENA